MVTWITGRPGAGKTTLARARAEGTRAIVLDGDEVRQWLTPDCGFTDDCRLRHATRVYQVAKLIHEAGGEAIVALVAHPPGPVDKLIYVDGPPRRPLWQGTTYMPPEHPDEIVKT